MIGTRHGVVIAMRSGIDLGPDVTLGGDERATNDGAADDAVGLGNRPCVGKAFRDSRVEELAGAQQNVERRTVARHGEDALGAERHRPLEIQEQVGARECRLRVQGRPVVLQVTLQQLLQFGQRRRSGRSSGGLRRRRCRWLDDGLDGRRRMLPLQRPENLHLQIVGAAEQRCPRNAARPGRQACAKGFDARGIILLGVQIGPGGRDGIDFPDEDKTTQTLRQRRVELEFGDRLALPRRNESIAQADDADVDRARGDVTDAAWLKGSRIGLVALDDRVLAAEDLLDRAPFILQVGKRRRQIESHALLLRL